MPFDDDCIEFIDEGTHVQSNDKARNARVIAARPMTSVSGR